MKTNENDNVMLDKIRECLDGEVENLDGRTLLALRSSRMEALDGVGRRRAMFGVPRWLTAGGLATAVVLLATVSIYFDGSPKPLPVKSAEEFEMLSINGQQELYSDLDFYRWLAEREDAG